MELFNILVYGVCDAIIASSDRPDKQVALQLLGSRSVRLLRETAQTIENTKLNIVRESIKLAACLL